MLLDDMPPRCCLTPVIYLLMSFIAFHFALHTPHRTHRRFLLAPFLAFAVLSFTTSKSFFAFVPSLTSLWAQSVALNILHVLSLLWIKDWPPPQTAGVFTSASFHASYRLWSDPQLLSAAGKSRDRKKNDDFSAHEATSNTEKHESALAFCITRLAKLPLYYYLHVWLPRAMFDETGIQLGSADVSPDKISLFTRLDKLSTRDVAIRSYTAVSLIWESIIVLDGTRTILATASVLSGLDEPSDWAPLFGNPSAACGLRSFLSLFWHHLARRPYISVGRVGAAHLPWHTRSRFAENATVAFLVFLLSGLSHGAVAWRLGYTDWVADVQWYLLNFGACSFETLLVWTWSQLVASSRWERELTVIEASWVGPLLGYAWTFSFFFWSVPMWRFPRMYGQLATNERWMRILSKVTIGPKINSGNEWKRLVHSV